MIAGQVIALKPVCHQVSQIFKVYLTVTIKICRNAHHTAFLICTPACLGGISIDSDVDLSPVARVFIGDRDFRITGINTRAVFIIGYIIILAVVKDPVSRMLIPMT